MIWRATRISEKIRVVRWRRTRLSRRETRVSSGIRVFRIGELEVRGTRSGELEAENSIFTHLLPCCCMNN